MELHLSQGAIQNSEADTLIVNLFQDVTEPTGATQAVDQALGGAIREVIEQGDLTGKLGEVTILYPRGIIPAARVLVVGLGPQEDFDAERIRLAAAAASRRARQLKSQRIATIVHGAGRAGIPAAAAAQATVEGTLLSLYRYQAPGHRAAAEAPQQLQSLTLVEFEGRKLPELERGMRAAEAIAGGVTLARRLVDLPPNVATPSHLAGVARELARAHGLKAFVGDREWAAGQRLGAFLAVAQGAGEPPAFIVLEHNAERDDLDTVVLVGKGITFDTGGISLKPSKKMGDMKGDMGGAAAVLGTMKAIAALELPLKVVAIAPCSENMPDARSYRPSDVITAGNGKTIEIISTDAEGRLVLADALVHAGRYAPRAVIDLATLTGSCVVALGEGVAAGLFGNDPALRDLILAASDATHERVWPLPLWEDYREAIRSQVADLKNSGGRTGGVGTSAAFLEAFTDYPWAHLDIAGMELRDQDKGYTPAGATGFGVRLLVELLQRMSDGAADSG